MEKLSKFLFFTFAIRILLESYLDILLSLVVKLQKVELERKW